MAHTHTHFLDHNAAVLGFRTVTVGAVYIQSAEAEVACDLSRDYVCKCAV